MNLLALVGAREQREPCKKLYHDAAERPHVDLLRVGEDSQHNVGGAIEPRLDVGVHDFILETATAEVSNGDSTFVLLLHKDVFWFEVAVDNPQVLEVAQPREELDGEASDQPLFEALIVVHFDELVQVYCVQVKNDAEMIPPDEVVLQFYYALNRIRVVLFEQKQQLSLNSSLVVVLLLVLHHFYGDVLSRLVIFAFEHLAESAFANEFFELKAETDLVT